MKRFLILLLSLSLLLTLVSCGAPTENGERTESTERTERTEGGAESTQNPAPDVTVFDRTGRAVRLSSLRGKPVVLNFWASWCPPCKGEMPDFEDAYRESGEDYHFVMVNLTDGTRETRESAYGFVDSMGYTFPVYCDESGEAAYAYGISSIPTTFFIDKDGNLVTYAGGAISAELLARGMEMIR